MKDYMVMLLRPMHHGPRDGWAQTTCPHCGQPVWDSDPTREFEAKLIPVTDAVYRACFDCSDAKAWERKQRQSSVQMKLWEEDAV